MSTGKTGNPERVQLFGLSKTEDAEGKDWNHLVYDSCGWRGKRAGDGGDGHGDGEMPCPAKDPEAPEVDHQLGSQRRDTVRSFFSSLSRRNLAVLGLCALANFLATSAFSVIAPFFPSVAKEKGMDLATVGLVFSLYQLGGVLVSPLIGNYLNRIGVKFVYLSGLMITGVSVICFGLLDKGPNGNPFIVMSILCRVVESVGAAGFTTASIAIVSSEFPNHVGTASAVLNTGSTLGIMVGPVLGGALYSLGGFGLPFYVIAGLNLCDAVLIYAFLPPLHSVDHTRTRSVVALMRHARVLVPYACVVVGIAAIGIYDATFATLVEPFDLSPPMVGSFYLITSGVHTLMSPIWGSLTDKVQHKELLTVFGLAGLGVGFLISGPSPLLPFVPFELWSVGVGFSLLGLSLGSITITTLACMVRAAHDLGYEKTVDTNGLVSGLYYSGYALGGFMGPLAGSVLVQRLGFPKGFTILGLVSILVMCLVAGYSAVGRCVGSRREWKDKYDLMGNGACGRSEVADTKETGAG